ncbi:family 10 glycosylhydrolase [Laspinema olomoucense]|uniref:family 10 glycosylhydrolase n=1 Tax=Laspinema olomoucense TaxID=3231600 RepID=UPI0021BB6917|nr:family 10 glycosylhydrolase [Laspinema sp. D3a]MCT7987166.1 family 10 glycosylhydrolase [Laspinema sp. D3a]
MPPQNQKKEPSGCGCASIPFSVILLFLGGGYFLFTQREHLLIRVIPANSRENIASQISRFIPENLQAKIPFLNASDSADAEEISKNLPQATPTPEPTPQQPQLPAAPISNPSPPTPTAEIKPPATLPKNPPTPSTPKSPWEKKAIRGIYFSRYQVTNNATEETIRARVRYYRDRGINTLIHGVWGNACTMYKSAVMQAKFGYESCPNEFEDKWLDWLIDEAHKHDMEVHAYFEKGIKIDENSPAFDLAVQRGWIVPGVDRTHPGVDHYVLNVGIPEVAEFFTNILVEFVTKYPKIDAVQWDDYLGYHAELPGQVDRTLELTKFVKKAISATKAANPTVSFDICHHNPYWAKRYFAADWENWGVDRVFIQVYADENFAEELPYVEAYDGISITERQFNRLEELVMNPKVDNILLFPLSGNPEKMADEVKRLTAKIK